MPVAESLTISLVMSGAAAVAGIVIAFWPGINAMLRRGGFFFVGLFAGIGAITWLLSTGLTLQAGGDPFDAVLGGWIILLVASAGYGVFPFLLAPKPVLTGKNHAEPLLLSPSEAGAWSHTITGTIFVWAALVVVVLGVVIYAVPISEGKMEVPVFGIVVMVLVLVLVAAFISLRVTADWRGLRVVSNVLHIPLKRIRLDQIAVVEAVDVLHPSQWGGWGYRVMPGRSALILKKGPGLIITTTAAMQFAITLPDPQTPASLLAALKDPAHSPSAAQEAP